jgi:hypothetical protein
MLVSFLGMLKSLPRTLLSHEMILLLRLFGGSAIGRAGRRQLFMHALATGTKLASGRSDENKVK